MATLSETAQVVRRLDPDRFLTALFAAPERRDDLFALYAFNVEVARIRESIQDPLLGHMRLQWWRDMLTNHFAGRGIHGHPVALALSKTISRHDLPRDLFETLLEGRERDMEERPMADQENLSAYIDATGGTIGALAARILGAEAAQEEIAQRVGKTYALAGILRAIPFHASHGRLYLPADMLAGYAVREEDVLGGITTPGLQKAVRELSEAGLEALAGSRRSLRKTGRRIVAAFLPATVAEIALQRLKAADYDPFETQLRHPVRHPLLMAWRAWRGRY